MNLEKNSSFDVSIIIPSRGMKESLERVLDSLEPELRLKKAEVIVVDDGSFEPLSFLEDKFKSRMNIRVIRQEPKGPASARNLGLKNTSAPIVCFLDSDVIVKQGWLSNILRPFEENPDIAGVEGKTICPDLEKMNPFSHYLDNLEGGKYLTCNIAYKREWLEKVNGFDERFKLPWREDSDLAFSILERNGKIEFAPEAIVFHPLRRVSKWRLFWFYPFRRHYDWLLRSKHPERFSESIGVITDKSELFFLFSLVLALGCFFAGYFALGFIFLFFHQFIYNHILLRRLSFGKRNTYNFAVPWRIYFLSYFFFWPYVLIALFAILWGFIKFGMSPKGK